MARHRLLDRKRSRKSHGRVSQSGVLYQVFYARLWITPPADITSIPVLHAGPAL